MCPLYANAETTLDLAKHKEEIFSEAMTEIRHSVLWEKSISLEGQSAWSGLTENYLRVFSLNQADLYNRITEVSISRDDKGFLWVSG